MGKVFLFEGDFELGFVEELTHIQVYKNNSLPNDIIYECVLDELMDEDDSFVTYQLWRSPEGEWWDYQWNYKTNISERIGEIIDQKLNELF